MRSNVSELLEKINRLAAKPNFPHLSLIEKDLFKHYLREMYEAMDHGQNVVFPKEEKMSAVPVSERIETKQLETMLVEKPFNKKQAEASENMTFQKTSSQTNESLTNVSLPPDTLSVKVTINDGVRPKTSLNELIKDSGKEMHKVFSSKPIRELIDFNKRYAIVNELFGRDVEAFANAVHRIDTSESYEAASNFIQNELTIKYSWDESSQSARLFYKLVKQRFGVDG